LTTSAEETAPITHARVLKIALPVVISNATVPLLGIVDTAVVGQLGDPVPIGAVGLGAIILSTVYWVFGFLRMGTVGLAAQAIGARDQNEVAALLSRVLMIGIGAGVVLILFQTPIFAAALWLAPASAEVEAMVGDYITIRIFSAPAAIALFGITGWLIAQERTVEVLILQLLQNSVNIALSAYLVLGLDLGVAGVATATFVAEWLGLALGLFFCRAAFVGPAWRDRARIFDPAKLRQMVLINTDILIRSLLLMSAITSFLFLAADFGDVTLAANQILIQFLYFTSYALDGFAFATEALVGQAVGARAVERLRRTVSVTSAWAAAVACLLSVVFWVFGGDIVDLMTTSAEVQVEARTFLFWLITVPLVASASFILDGIFIGATRTRDMRNMMAVSFAGYVTLAVVLVPIWGNHGLWAALLGFFALRGVTLAIRYPALEREAV